MVLKWLGSGHPEVGPKSRIQGQTADLRSDPRKHQEKSREVRPGKKGNKYRLMNKQIVLWQLGLGPEEELWESVWDMLQSCPLKGHLLPSIIG